MSRLTSLLSSLPYYYARSIEEFNVDNVTSAREWFSGVAEKLSEIDTVLTEVKESRSIDDAFDFGLDMVGNRVGVVRQSGESDDELRERIKWEIRIQESWGNRQQLRKIITDFLQRKDGRVWTSVEDQVVQSGPDKLDLSLNHDTEHSHTDERQVEEKDIYVWSANSPWLSLYGPLDEDDPKFGKLMGYTEVDIPWPAVPFVSQIPFEPVDIADYSNDENNLPQNDSRAVGTAPLDISIEALDIDELVDVGNRSRAGGVQLEFRGFGGFMPLHPPNDDEGQFSNDPVHGVAKGRLDGFLSDLSEAYDTHGSSLWRDIQLETQ